MQNFQAQLQVPQRAPSLLEGFALQSVVFQLFWNISLFFIINAGVSKRLDFDNSIFCVLCDDPLHPTPGQHRQNLWWHLCTY